MSLINVDQIRSFSFIGNPVDLNGVSVRYTSVDSIIGIGQGALQLCTGPDNVAIGKAALNVVTSGDDNTAIGGGALLVTTGNNNVGIGRNAGYLNTTGGNNIFIGLASTGSSPSAINEITLGNSSHTVIRAAVTSITSLSDERDKSNVEDSTYGLELVKSLRPVTFEWDTRDGAKKGVKDLGFIAQELQSVDNEHLGLVYDENPEKLEATYGRLIPVLVKAIQELTAKVEALEAK